MDGAGCFDRDMTFLSTKFLAELAKFLEDHRLSPGNHDVRGGPFGGCGHDSFNVP